MALFRGGMQFREGRPVRLSSPPAEMPAEPIRITCDAEPLVNVGDGVRAGHLVYHPENAVMPTRISPIEGKVTAVTRWRGPRATSASVRQQRGEHDWYDVSITPTHDRTPTSLDMRPPDRADAEAWADALVHTGAWSQPGIGWDLATQLASARIFRPEALICIGLDMFPPYPDRSSILMSFPDDAALGMHLLGDILKAKRTIMVASQAGRVGARVRRACRTFKVRCHSVENIYPGADPMLVVRHHAPGRRTLAHGENPMNSEVVLISPWTAIRLARWVTLQRLDVIEPMFVAWPRAGTPMSDRWVFPGQPLVTLDPALAGAAHVLGGRAVLGNPMTGRPIEAPTDGEHALLPVTPDDERLVTVLSPQTPRPPEPCISCGWCVEVCPTWLRPIELVERCEAGRRELVRDELDACIDCGLCSHVCPSAIELAQLLRVSRDTRPGDPYMPVASSAPTGDNLAQTS